MHTIKIYPDKDTRVGELAEAYKKAWIKWDREMAFFRRGIEEKERLQKEVQRIVNVAFTEAVVAFPTLDFEGATITMDFERGCGYTTPYFIVKMGSMR